MVWVAAAVTVVVVAVAAVLIVMRGDDSEPTTDCGVVSSVFAQWNDTVGAAEAAITSGEGGREGTLDLADAESSMASAIREAEGDVDSADIAGYLDQWASGAEQIAQSRRDQVNDPNRSVTDPAPRGYVEGSLSTQTAIASLVSACPEARQPSNT
ncbi:Uncharacterised protein [Mycolicibacterium tokaiense]|uniref:Uncharacterized protein n=1 Tax=Mycolicibacterium tokaiense TaxID=39695 RepID=A0A378TP42_9MYCO|nr:Uncharacterised protein [Mycolicibacterium tokaiense]